jgi:transcriptional regulator with XRE-family HTH domain
MSLGERLHNLLDERDMTQKQLADLLCIGISTLGNYFQNTREPDHKTLKQLAYYFNVSIDYLLDYRVDQTICYQENELLRIFRALTHDQQELFIKQGKLFITQNYKKITSSNSMTSSDNVS